MRHSGLALSLITLLLGACQQQQPEELHLARGTAPAGGPPVIHESSLPIDSSKLILGQLIYAPIYSEVLFFDEKVRKLTAANLSIRNTSTGDSLYLHFVDYYDDHGKLLRNYLSAPLVLGPLGSTTFIIEQRDESAGAGANFLLEWTSRRPISPPLVETITLQYIGPRGLAFRSPSQVLREKPAGALPDLR